jgi:hypothetical protein
MAASLTQLTGGNFQDCNGSPLSYGYLTLKLSQDGNVAGVGNICSGVTITIQLDINGNVASLTSPTPVANQYVWANSNISPINTYYKVTGFTQQGERAFGLNNQQVAAGATFNVGTWVPNSVLSWFPNPQSLALEVNGVPASSQTLQDLVNSATVTVIDNGDGEISFEAAAGGFPSGANVATLPVLVPGTASSSLNGYTTVLKIPANYIQSFATAGLQIAVLTASSTVGLVLHSASVGLTLPGATAWSTPPVSFTFPAGAFANTSTLYLSNVCPIAFDASHDIYITLYWDPASASGAAYTDLPDISTTVPGFAGWTGFSGYLSGNHAADASATALQSLGGGTGGAFFCIQQVLTA